MSTTQDGYKQLSVKGQPDLIDEFERAVIQAQADGMLRTGDSKSAAVRRFMRYALDNPEVFEKLSEYDSGT